MMRGCYLTALCVLQVMLAWQLVPIVALVLMRHVPLGHAADGWPAVMEVASAALCVIGSGLSLSYPCIVLMRHLQRGAERFAGVPRWAVALMFCGGALLGMHFAVRLAGPWLPVVDGRPLATMVPLAAPGVALMSAGVLLAELLRRSRPTRTRVLSSIMPTVRMRRLPGRLRVEPAMRHVA